MTVPQIEQWLTTETDLCQRYQVLLTASACSEIAAKDDGRCHGCGGLQSQTPAVFRPVVVPEKTPGDGLDEAEKEHCEVKEQRGKNTADVSSSLCDLELPELDDLLMGLVDEEDDEPVVQRRPSRKKSRLVAVYLGRCERCGGYMLNTIDGFHGEIDHEVYRCFNCGWRVSPVYQFNRNNRGESRSA